MVRCPPKQNNGAADGPLSPKNRKDKTQSVKKIREFLTSLSLVLAFAALVVKANYNVYQLRESGGTGGGPWFQYVGTAGSPLGGNIALTTDGSAILLDNRTFWPTAPTTIDYSPPGAGLCDPYPCLEQN